MNSKIGAWLRLFRVVNLPTVPGDILAGAAVASFGTPAPLAFKGIMAASATAVLLYMYGLADNDIVGAATDNDRPIPEGIISLGAARAVRSFCLYGAIALAYLAGLPAFWWPFALATVICILIYNRTKSPLLMGLCRGLNILCGYAASYHELPANIRVAVVAALVWTAYIAAVTKYSEGEEADPARKRRVGLLIGALVWLQLAVVAAFSFLFRDIALLAVQLAMIALLFILKRLMPKVSAS